MRNIVLTMRAIHNVLIANNICTELTVDTTGGHGVFRNASSLFRAKRASCFFKSIFCNTCGNFYTTDSIAATCSMPVNVEIYDINSAIKVYPNPFEYSLTIEGIEGFFEATIYNALGQIVAKSNTNHITLPMDLLAGMYMIRIEQTETKKTYSIKLIKQ